MTEFEFEQQVRSIESAVISNVWYETDEEDALPNTGEPDYHAVSRAVYLQTADQRYFRITWADQLNIYHGFGASLKQVPLYPERNPQLIPAGHLPVWQQFFGKPVRSTTIHWQFVLHNMRHRLVPLLGMGYLRRTDYPQTIELLFDQETSLFFSALSIGENDQVATMTNHLTVFFSKTKHDFYNQPLRKW
ncbi:hypothetical protein [Paraflavitalea sp. CAU 1676]|uniref:hypothetical protein n=1 Tax=Paraflavitalea sp. CAU 1676 TaxID=3032598 RepID=UPI0023DA9339|nr:hypothetical protein [Paraflavitalea sp. CAU 1676]MDF2188617.1 hypothetical protein [Paraflavitalea sp. CAU 1676]